jgi:hypothetical protein
MINFKWLRLCGSTASVAIISLIYSACLVSGVRAQSAAAAQSNLALGQTASSTFLVAPSIHLAYAPTGVAMGDLNGDGKSDLITADYVSGRVTVYLGVGDGTFAAGVDYDAGPHPGSIVVADINGDGKLDVIVSSASEGTISLLSGVGDGTLQSRKSYPVGFSPVLLATGDFNGDGKTDVAVAGNSGKSLAVLLNDGKGNLINSVSYPLGKVPTSLAVADFNNDGHADIALANTDGTVSVLLGNGNGAFRLQQNIGVASGPLSSIVAADFNKDGKIDLAVTQSGQNLVSVLVGKGDGSFVPAVSYPVGNNPVSSIVADVDGDGIPDLVVINQGSNTFSVLRGNGDGAFKGSLDFVAGNGPLAGIVGDFNGDGHIDLAIINYASQTVSVPLGNGDGTFKAGRSYASDLAPRAIASGDLNGDKKPDLVVANYCGADPACLKGGSVSVLLAEEGGGYKLASTYTVGAGPVAVALVDVDSDKNLDIVALNRLDKTVTVLLGVGDGTFQQPIAFPLAEAPVAVAVGDFSQDGKPDLAVLEDCGAATCTQPGSLEILLGSGDGNFHSSSTYTVGYSPSSLAVGDINGDKNLDILAANRCGNDASCQSPGTGTVLFGDGTGRFTTGNEIALGNSPSSIALGDLSGAAALDLVVAQSADNTVSVRRGNGDGSFKAAVPYPVGVAPGSVVIADFDGDGNPDVAVSNLNDSTISVLFGTGNGTLHPAASLTVGSGPASLSAVGRTTGGHASLATANGNSASTIPGTQISVVSNLKPDPPLATFVLASSPAASNVNQGVVLTATLTGASPNAAPSGTVTFNSGSAALSDCTNVAVTQGVSPSLISTATCPTSMLTAGSDSLTAVYSGDPTYDTGVGETTLVPVVQSVTSLAPTFTLSAVPSTSLSVGTSVTFTAQLGGVALTPILPTGTVTFTINGASISDCPAVVLTSLTGPSATCTTASLVAPADNVQATYTLDTNFTVANPAVLPVNVAKSTPAITLTSSPAPSSVNQQVTFTATILAPGGATAQVQPTGSVTFTQGSTTLCNAAGINSSNHTATCVYTFTAVFPSPGTTITATYTGDQNFTAGTPGTLAQIVQATSTTTKLVASPSASSVNQQVTFTASIVPGVAGSTSPTGSVTFSYTLNGGSSVPLCASVPVGTASGVTTAVCSVALPAAGAYTISAVFAPGDTNFTGSNVTAPLTVSATATTITVGASPTSLSVNQPVTFTATVTPAVAGSTHPTGAVTFSYTLNGGSSVILCASASVSTTSGVSSAVCASTLPSSGNYTITAAYTSSDSNFSGGTGTAIQAVGLTLTTTTVVASASTSTVNQSVLFTATVTPATQGSTPPAGTVTFSYTTSSVTTPVNLCASVAVSSSTPILATCSAPLPAVGVYAITATYSGDKNFASSSAAITSYSVTSPGTSVSMIASSTSLVVNQPVSFSATISTGTSGATLPTGTMTFTDKSTTPASTLCNNLPLVVVSLSPVTTVGASCPSVTQLALGNHTIVATYSGDANFPATASSATLLTVGKATTALSVTTSASTAVAEQVVFFTATVTPQFQSPGGTAPSGLVQFTSSDPDLAVNTICKATTVAAANNGTSLATCTVQFPLNESGQYTVSASYSGDSNFAPNSNTTGNSVQQTIQNFSVAFTAPTSGPVTLTQKYSNSSDPFTPATITVTSTPLFSFNDPLTGTCTVINTSVTPPAAVSDPSCTVTPLAGGSTQAWTYTVSASANAPIGPYSLLLTAADSATPALKQSTTVPVVVYVVAQSGTVNLSTGATSTEEDVTFDTATLPSGVAPKTLVSFACGTIWNLGTNLAVSGSPLTCSGPSATVNVTGSQTTVPITISGVATTTAQVQRSSASYAAALLGLPLLALIGWIGGRKSQHRNFFRFLGLVLLIVGLSYASGCGGSYTKPPTQPGLGISSGTYLVQVVATDQNGAKYFTAVPLDVSSN